MAGKRYYWLRLKDDFFDSKRIKKLRRMAGGDTYTIIYLKLQLLAIKSDGILTFTGLEDSVAAELALDIDENPENVAITLNYLASCGLMESDDNVNFFLPYAVANTGSEGASAQRVREYRERKALQCNTDVTPMQQISNGEIDTKERVIERVKEKEIEIEPQAHINQSDITLLIEHWNALGLTKVVKILPTSQRYKLLQRRIKDYGFEAVIEAIDRIAQSDYLLGRVNNFQINFDWFVKPNNFVKVAEGNYDNRETSNGRNTEHISGNGSVSKSESNATKRWNISYAVDGNAD